MCSCLASCITDEALQVLEERTFKRLHDSGLVTRMGALARLEPRDFAAVVTGSGGALYGVNQHGLFAPLARLEVRSATRGLYRASRSTHPGPLLAMQIASGRRAAYAVLDDLEQG
jgi:phytoene dehydrogenase-like protein